MAKHMFLVVGSILDSIGEIVLAKNELQTVAHEEVWLDKKRSFAFSQKSLPGGHKHRNTAGLRELRSMLTKDSEDTDQAHMTNRPTDRSAHRLTNRPDLT